MGDITPSLLLLQLVPVVAVVLRGGGAAGTAILVGLALFAEAQLWTALRRLSAVG